MGEDRRRGVLSSGDRPRLFCQLRVRRRKGEPKGFTWQHYRDLIIVTHRQLDAPVVWCWDNLNVHLAPELAEFAACNSECVFEKDLVIGIRRGVGLGGRQVAHLVPGGGA